VILPAVDERPFEDVFGRGEGGVEHRHACMVIVLPMNSPRRLASSIVKTGSALRCRPDGRLGLADQFARFRGDDHDRRMPE